MLTNKETISRLKFIRKIEINDKIDLKNMSITHDGIFTQLSRTVFQDNRNKTLVFLQDTINKAFEIIKCYDKSTRNSDKIMCSNVVTDLKGVRIGLKNLKETYNADIKFCCDIDVLLEMIEAKLSETDMETFLSLTPPSLNPPPFPKEFEERYKKTEGDDL
jgi:hypothetical protein